MSLFRWGRGRGTQQRFFGIENAGDLITRQRSGRRVGSQSVTTDSALRHSAVWACLRLRADLVSTMPLDVYRYVSELDLRVKVTTPPFLVSPGGPDVDLAEWLYSRQFELDRSGNAVGIISERNGYGLPARVDLVPTTDVTIRMKAGTKTYFVGGKAYRPDEIWHEKQFTVAGLDVGLSPIAYAAWTVGEYLSAQQFALDWFGNGKLPAAHMKNIAKVIDPAEAAKVKDRYAATMSNGELFVYGQDWEFSLGDGIANQTDFLDAKRYGLTDVARFMGCPGDLIDAAVSTGSITYANISQRNLQFLIMNLQPPITRLERRLTRAVPAALDVKLNTNALLRMDPETRAKVLDVQLKNRTVTNDEARAIDDRAPLTDAEIERMNAIYGPPPGTGTAQPVEPQTPQEAQLSARAAVPSLSRVADLDLWSQYAAAADSDESQDIRRDARDFSAMPSRLLDR